MSYIILEKIDIGSLINAHEQLRQALQAANNELEKTGTIHHFVCCYELAWKAVKQILIYKCRDNKNPAAAFREAKSEGIIQSATVWIDFLRLRNQSVHTYDDKIFQEIVTTLPNFEQELNRFIKQIKQLKKTYYDCQPLVKS